MHFYFWAWVIKEKNSQDWLHACIKPHNDNPSCLPNAYVQQIYVRIGTCAPVLLRAGIVKMKLAVERALAFGECWVLDARQGLADFL